MSLRSRFDQSLHIAVNRIVIPGNTTWANRFSMASQIDPHHSDVAGNQMIGEPFISATVFTEAVHEIDSGNWILRSPVMAFENKLV